MSVKKNRVLIFDVETTGLLPKRGAVDFENIETYPYIIQLSFIVYNLLTNEVEMCKDCYIRIPDEIVVSEKITELTGITKQMCNEKGVPIEDAMIEFYNAHNSCDMIIAHNYEFDSSMMMVELMRNRVSIYVRQPDCFHMFNIIYEKINGIENYCTMKNSVDICNIMTQYKGGKPYKKWPTLLELYKNLFDKTPENLHNSIVDTLVCLRCFLKINKGIEMGDEEYGLLMNSALAPK